MSLSDQCIKRPVFATVLNLLIVVFGLAGLAPSELARFLQIVALRS